LKWVKQLFCMQLICAIVYNTDWHHFPLDVSMRNSSLLCNEEQMRVIQKITNASRQDILHTIHISRISVEEIIRSLKKSALNMLPFAGRS